ncbi:poly-gamma-glutamate synthesis protein (capsule biosynthesis protein) [Nitrosospira multiformis]|uniref:Poly-gamma-glutamate synthesis protein (Capsule biosynthesis protein) n=2 Tax=Nitrosospira multiformis TaxID=1231 RepID=A0A1H8CNZ8_9PROT|nr:poly-gamma-glutamate synthesis protein (capsule biosynthesis protein) [Nitrosospira multiformis]
MAIAPLYAQALRNGLQISVKNDDQTAPGLRSLGGHTSIKLFLCGDVMTGRGIDQILPHPGNPILFEGYMKSATGYVGLAEEANGPIPHPVPFSYIWGDALAELELRKPDVRVINLETAVTRSDDAQDKAVNYRMNPDNISCITAAKIDCCVLANNHVLDWGYEGLAETLKTLKRADIKIAGAGLNVQEAQQPAEMTVPGKGRVLVFSLGSETSGIPWSWAARADRPGVTLLPDFSVKTVREIRDRIKQIRRPGDIVVASIHWGNNWGYAIPVEQQDFAHALIDEGGVDVIHGHSSHHVKGIEVYKGKLILYGCGDFLNDYEGISGHEAYRGDLTLMYFVRAEPQTGKMVSLSMVPMQVRHFRLNRTSDDDASWLKNILNREGKKLGTSVELAADNTLMLRWTFQG